MAQLPRRGDTFGRYRIETQIGQGGMGVVYGATDLTLDRRVALKVVSAHLGDHDEFLARFEREAALLARLDSPHVIGILDAGEHDDCPYIATQLVRGGDLGDLLARRGPMPPTLAARVCAQVADALADAHAAGVVHRDVKPTNVLLRDADVPDLHAYLCDFGIARTAEESGLTVAGSVSGTWTYLAPECGQGRTATPASDLYSVGCLLWATLTGSAPFRGTDVEVAVAHQRAPVPQLAGDDPFTLQVNAVLRGTLAKRPEERLPDAATLRDLLLAASTSPAPPVAPRPAGDAGRPPSRPGTPLGTPPRTPPGTPPGTPPLGPSAPRRRRRTLAVVGAVVGVLLVAGGVVAVVTLGGDDEPGGTAGPSPSASAEGSETPQPTDGPTESPTDPPTSGAGRTGDVDDDGLGDLLFERSVAEEQMLFTLLSDGTAFGEPQSEPTGQRRNRGVTTLLADPDGDGVDEVVEVGIRFRSDSPADVVVRAPDGTVESESTMTVPTSTELVTYYPGDVDGDGREDLVVAVWDQDTPFRFFVLIAGDDGYGEPSPVLEVEQTLDGGTVEVGDVDGDGVAEIVVASTRDLAEFRYRTTVAVYGFDDARYVPRGEPRTVETGLGPDLALADLDGDGAQELLLVDLFGAGDDVPVLSSRWTERGPGRFRPAGLLGSGSLGFTVSDVDGDGRDDLVNLYRTPDRMTRVLVEVALSRGEGLDTARRWATLRLEDPEAAFLSVVGSTFP